MARTYACCSILAIGLLWLTSSTGATASASVLKEVHVRTNHEQRSEVAFTITGKIQTSDVDALARCLPKHEHKLPKKGDPAEHFRAVRWQNKHLATLAQCNLKRCVFNLPKWTIRQIMAARSLDEKKNVYYRAVHRLTWAVDKTRKHDRIEAHDLKGLSCAQHDQFHWLLNGAPRSWDRLIWRKHFGDSRMRPTLKTLQIASWRKGPHRCVGATTLFADHYYWDGIDLLELTPAEPGVVAFRLHVRERYDIFGGFWARRFRGTIRKKVRQRKFRDFERRVAACLKP